MTADWPPPPRISIVIASRNSAPTIGRALDSVLSQDYPDVEVIVIDGASTDGTVAAISERAERITYWVSEPDRGVYDAWNKALLHVTGDWILFLGSDDQLAAPTTLSAVAPYLRAANGHQRVVYGAVDVVDADGIVLRHIGESWESARVLFRDRMAIPHPATFQHRSLFAEHGRFDDAFRIAGDYEFLLRELLERDALFMPDLTVVQMSAGGLSDDPRLLVRHLQESYRARYEHGLVAAPPWRSRELVRSTTHARLTRLFGRRAADYVGDVYRRLSRMEKPRSTR